MSDLLDDLRSYGEAVERAAVHHASDRLLVAQLDGLNPGEGRSTRRHLAVAASVIVGALLIALALGWLFQGDDQEERAVIVDQPTTSMTASPTPTGTGPTPEELQAADELLAQQQANGWVPYGGGSAIPGGSAQEGWVRYQKLEDMAPTFDDSGNVVGRHLERFPVYDAPNGAIIGYHYSGVGFVPLDQLETFDATAARIEMWGCDPYAPGCTPVVPGEDSAAEGGG